MMSGESPNRAELKWWIRYVIVPLIGTIVGIIVAFIARDASTTVVIMPTALPPKTIVETVQIDVTIEQVKFISETLTPTLPNSTETETVVPPTPNPKETAANTATTVSTSTPTNTEAPKPTNTLTPIPPTQTPENPSDTIQVQTNTQDVGVFYGPSTENLKASILKFNEVVQAIGKVRGSLFYEVLLDNGITGWVEGEKVDFVSGSDEDVPLTWPRTGSIVSDDDSSNSSGSSSSSGCSFQIWVEENQVNDVFIHWSNLPQDTRWLVLKVLGRLNGRNTNLIEPNTIDANDVDTQENGFMLGSWRFDPDDPSWKGFPENTQFTFTLEAQDENRNGMCSKSSTFTQ